MRIFLTGATGYIGGSMGARLVADGHRVRGLVRTREKADALAERGIEPVLGSLDDGDLLTREAAGADAVVNTADADHRPSLEALLRGLEGSGKPLLHTSGTSIVADEARGEASDRIFGEDTPLEPVPAKVGRVAIDRLVLEAADRGVRSAVLCNSLIYGQGLGLHAESVQVPLLVDQARKHGAPRHIGRGLNIWSNVHIEDMAELYQLALAKAAAGTFFFVENGEASFLEMTQAIGRRLGLGAPQSWPVPEAIAELGMSRAVYTLASNSRVRARRARALGWAPRHGSVVDWIGREMPI